MMQRNRKRVPTACENNINLTSILTDQNRSQPPVLSALKQRGW